MDNSSLAPVLAAQTAASGDLATHPSGPVTMERPSSRHIPSLDGYRGIAFLMVFLRHYTLTRHATSPILLGVARLGEAGWIGVDLFFVLSGFLITGILLDTRSDPHYFRNFIARRALRIFPLYYTVLFGMLLLTPLLHLEWHRGHIAYFFYLGNIAANINPDVEWLRPCFTLMHLWSLSVEEQFYLLWPLIVYFAATGKRVVRICAALSVFALLVRIALFATLPEGSAMEWCSAQLPTRMDGLLYGAISSVLVRRYTIEQIAPWARWAMAGSAILLAGIFFKEGANFANRPMSLVGYPLLAVFFTTLLLLAMQRKSPFASVGKLAPLRTLGRYSYGLYVYHLIAGPAIRPLLPWLQTQTHSIAIGGILFTLIAFFGTLVLAVASYELYERHFLRLKRYFHYGKKPANTVAAAAFHSAL